MVFQRLEPKIQDEQSELPNLNVREPKFLMGLV